MPFSPPSGDAPSIADPVVRALVSDRPRFVAFARVRLGSVASADDVVQTAFARALEQRDTLEDSSRATAWFYRILRNALIDHGRRTQASARTVERAAAEPEPSNDPRLAPTPCRCVLAVLRSLRADQAGLIEVVDIEGVTVAEAALLFGITANNASVRLHRARAALRDGLARRCGKCSLEGCGDCSCREPAA